MTFSPLVRSSLSDNSGLSVRSTPAILSFSRYSGRKTWKSLPKKLPNRENIVITNNFISEADLCCNVEEIIKRSKQEDFIIIVGASIYQQFKDYVDIIELTYVIDCKKFDTNIKWLEKHLKDYTIKNENNIISLDRTDNISKKISFITYIK